MDLSIFYFKICVLFIKGFKISYFLDYIIQWYIKFHMGSLFLVLFVAVCLIYPCLFMIFHVCLLFLDVSCLNNSFTYLRTQWDLRYTSKGVYVTEYLLSSTNTTRMICCDRILFVFNKSRENVWGDLLKDMFVLVICRNFWPVWGWGLPPKAWKSDKLNQTDIN